jgi:outer membrane protein assembly factor BamA
MSRIASVAVGVDYNRTDIRLLPTKGYRLAGTVEVAGGDYHFTKENGEATLYQTLFETKDGLKHILALSGRAGVVKAYSGDSSVPIFERFYAGGQGSVRGFAYRGLGPRQGDTPLGGEFSAVGSIEYLFPLYQTTEKGRTYEMLRGVLFTDIGQVAYKLSDVGSTKWRVSVGFGLRISIPALGGAPIALDFGFPIVKDKNDDVQFFSFNVGTEF